MNDRTQSATPGPTPALDQFPSCTVHRRSDNTPTTTVQPFPTRSCRIGMTVCVGAGPIRGNHRGSHQFGEVWPTKAGRKITRSGSSGIETHVQSFRCCIASFGTHRLAQNTGAIDLLAFQVTLPSGLLGHLSHPVADCHVPQSTFEMKPEHWFAFTSSGAVSAQFNIRPPTVFAVCGL